MMLFVRTSGLIEGIYDEALNLEPVGELSIRRVSHVEPANDGQWWADLLPLSGPRLGPFDRRSDAIAAELAWLELKLCDGPVRP